MRGKVTVCAMRAGRVLLQYSCITSSNVEIHYRQQRSSQTQLEVHYLRSRRPSSFHEPPPCRRAHVTGARDRADESDAGGSSIARVSRRAMAGSGGTAVRPFLGRFVYVNVDER